MDRNCLLLPPDLVAAGWKVKIFAKELPVEEPRATIVRGKCLWRIGRRTLRFMGRRPSPRDVDPRVIEAIRSDVGLAWLRERWNAVHPINPD